MKISPVTVLFIIALVIVFTFTGFPIGSGVDTALAQQSTLEQPAIAQGDAPKDVVKVTVPETLEKFKPVSETDKNHPRFDSKKPEETWLDWTLDRFCASEGLRYSWSTHECVPAEPGT